MRRVLTIAQMREGDRYTIERLGIAEEDLILRAGEALAGAIWKRFRGGRVLFVCGRGNNGKDGAAAAQSLALSHGFQPDVFWVEQSSDGVFQGAYDIVVDCIFGVGLNRAPEGKYRAAIEAINASGAFVVACDIASGVNADTGFPMGAAVRADMTVAIQELKYGHLINDGIDYAGETVTADIGISLWEDNYGYCLEREDIAAFFPDRARNVHKGMFGKSCLIGGSRAYSGAVLLAAQGAAALKMGCGYVNLAVPAGLFDLYMGKVPECTMKYALPEENGELICDPAVLEEICANSRAVAVGMGMGASDAVYSIVSYLIEHFSGVLVIDADALNALSVHGIEILKRRRGDVLLTPHVGEFSRLSGKSAEVILNDPVGSARSFAAEHGVTVLLKSCVSVLTDGARVCFNATGSSGMAKGGSGDVLSGFIVGLAARGLDAFSAASVGSWVMGKAGERAEKELTAYAMTPSEVIGKVGEVLRSLGREEGERK